MMEALRVGAFERKSHYVSRGMVRRSVWKVSDDG